MMWLHACALGWTSYWMRVEMMNRPVYWSAVEMTSYSLEGWDVHRCVLLIV